MKQLAPLMANRACITRHKCTLSHLTCIPFLAMGLPGQKPTQLRGKPTPLWCSAASNVQEKPVTEQSNKCKSGRGFLRFGLILLNSLLPPEYIWCPKTSHAEPGCDGPACRRQHWRGPEGSATLLGLCLLLPGSCKLAPPHPFCKLHH